MNVLNIKRSDLERAVNISKTIKCGTRKNYRNNYFNPVNLIYNGNGSLRVIAKGNKDGIHQITHKGDDFHGFDVCEYAPEDDRHRRDWNIAKEQYKEREYAMLNLDDIEQRLSYLYDNQKNLDGFKKLKKINKLRERCLDKYGSQNLNPLMNRIVRKIQKRIKILQNIRRKRNQLYYNEYRKEFYIETAYSWNCSHLKQPQISCGHKQYLPVIYRQEEADVNVPVVNSDCKGFEKTISLSKLHDLLKNTKGKEIELQV